MLDIDIMLLGSCGIIFLLVLVILNNYLYKPLFKHIDNRTLSIKKDFELSKNNDFEIKNLLDESKKVISDAKKEASRIREKAMQEAKEIANTKLTNSKSELNNKFDDFIKSLENEKRALKEHLSSNLPSFEDNLKNKISSI